MYMDILLLVLTTVGALLIGVFIGRKSIRSDGMFIVDDSRDETTRWILDVKIDPKTIPNRKEIRLKVRKMNEGVV